GCSTRLSRSASSRSPSKSIRRDRRRRRENGSVYARRLLVCALLSAMAHGALKGAMAHAPRSATSLPAQRVAVRLVAPPEPPAEPPPPRRAPPPPRVVHEPPSRERPARQAAKAASPAEPTALAPTDRAGTAEGPVTPVFGLSMESTSQAGRGAAVPVGNTARP